MGLKLQYGKSHGPSITPPARDGAAIDALPEVDADALKFVLDAIRRTREELDESIPLIGFAGAPFTLASYIVEGGSSRHYLHTKTLMARDEGAWNALMEKIVRGQVTFLNRQITAGAQAVQLFDSWAGCLSPEQYRRHVKPHTAALLSGLKADVPVIHFSTGTTGFLRDVREAGGSVIGVDWRVDLDRAWAEVGDDVGLMGNLDPVALLGDEALVRREAERNLKQADGRPGHIFNQGNGVIPETPV